VSDPESLLSDISFGILLYEERGKEFSGKTSLDWRYVIHFVLFASFVACGVEHKEQITFLLK
jgi:hypothetical protein